MKSRGMVNNARMGGTEQYAGKLEGLDWNPASASMRT